MDADDVRRQECSGLSFSRPATHKAAFRTAATLSGTRIVQVEAQPDDDPGLAGPAELDMAVEMHFTPGQVVDATPTAPGLVEVTLPDGTVCPDVPADLLAPTNSLMVIEPYRFAGTWVFDDPDTGLVREPFVSGVPAILDALLAAHGVQTPSFRLTFAATPFPGCQLEATLDGAEAGGHWYKTPDGQRGWLCPALLKYFLAPPPRLYARVD